LSRSRGAFRAEVLDEVPAGSLGVSPGDHTIAPFAVMVTTHLFEVIGRDARSP
jgi:hypothetical protein